MDWRLGEFCFLAAGVGKPVTSLEVLGLLSLIEIGNKNVSRSGKVAQ